MVKTSRAQREALKRVYRRELSLLVINHKE